MVTKQDFKSFYDQKLSRHLDFVEKERKKLVINIIVFLGLVLTTIPLSIFFVLGIKKSSPSELLYFLPLLPIIVFGLYMAMEPYIKGAPFYKHFKIKVINKIIQFIQPKLNYDKKMYVPKHEYLQSQFFDPKDDVSITGDDHVSGVIDRIKIEFSELKSRYLDKKTVDAFQFRGIFFVGRFPTRFDTHLVISNKHQEGFIIPNTSNIKFNQYFRLRLLEGTESDLQAFLGEALLEDCVEFYEELKKDLYISFLDNKMYVGIAHDKDLFEPRLWRSNKDYDFVHSHFLDLYYPITIIEHFALKSQEIASV